MLNRFTHVSRAVRSAMLALLAATLSSCGSASTDGVVDPGSISISLGSAAGTLTAGGSTTVTVTVGRSGAFTGAVDLSVEGLPTGVTATLTPSQLAAGVTSSTVTLNAATTAAAGAATLTVRAKGTGLSDKTATFALTLQAAQSTGAFTLSLAPTSLSVAAGANGTSTITIARTGSFTGAVSLAVSGAPAGVTATLSSASVTGTSATLTVAVAAGTAASTGTITVTGSGTGVANQTASLSVTTTVVATGSFALTLAPATLSVAAGTSGTSTITIARTAPFAGAVDLVVSGAPAGVTATLSSASVTGNTATLTVPAAASAAASTSTVTVTGSAAGVSNATGTLALTTTLAPGGGTGNIIFRFCETPFPTWLAVQDGSGAWTRVTGTNNTFSFDLTSATGGVAYAVVSGATVTTNVYYGTKAEITARGVSTCPTAVGKTITGSTAGLSGTDQGFITFGNRSTTVIPAGGTTFTLNGVADGARDLIAARTTLAFSGTSVSASLAKIILRRGLNPATGSSLPVLDFGSEGFAPGTATATLNNLGSDQSLMTVLYATPTANGILYTDVSTGGASRTFSGVPTASQAAGEFHYVQASAFAPGAFTDPVLATTSRSAGIYFGALANQTLTLGPALSTPTVTTAATAPYARLRSVLARQAEYNQFFYVTFQQAGSTPRNAVIEATASYLGAGAFDVTFPDFTSAGYDPTWGLKTGVSTTWVENASGWSLGTGVVTPTAGTTVFNAQKGGTITP
jgi:hypothetical protein